MHKHIPTLILPVGFGLGLLVACYPTSTIVNDDHCAHNGGDTYCGEQFPDKPYCQIASCNGDDSPKWGCVAEQPSAECWAECGQEIEYVDGEPRPGELTPCEDTGSDSDSDSTDATDSDSTETGPMLCEGPQDCMDAAAPFCNMDGACVACDAMPEPDGACAGVDAELPVCFEEACVACAEGKVDACVGTTPICDTEANVCEGCSEHEQCTESACNLAEGNCIDPAAVVHVDASGMNCPGADGTEANPFCTIGSALANTGAEVVIILHEINGMVEYAETNSIAKPVALFAALGERPIVRAAGPNPTLTVAAAGSLFMREIRLANGPGAGMLINGGQAWIERSEIVNNTGGGIVVSGGGILMLENSFVGDGTLLNDSAVEIIDGSSAISYSTIASGFGANAAGLRCADGTGSVLSDSIVLTYSDSPAIACPNMMEMDNFLETDSPMPFNDLSTWFVDFPNGDFHLTGTHPPEIETAALWQVGDPTTDIDGDARPTTDGTPDFAGADRIP